MKHHLTEKSVVRSLAMVRQVLRDWDDGGFFPGHGRAGTRFDFNDFGTQVAAQAADGKVSEAGPRRPQTAGRNNRRTPAKKGPPHGRDAVKQQIPRKG